MKTKLLTKIRREITYSIQPNKTFLVYFKKSNKFEIVKTSKDLLVLLLLNKVITLSLIHKIKNKK